MAVATSNSNFGTKNVGIDFEVFLNFRGPDTRQTLVDILHEKLENAGIRVFYDAESIRTSEEIGEEIKSAIKSCQIYIAIFSADYASSPWCLRELDLIMSQLRKSEGSSSKHVIPIFCDVKVDDVKLRTQLYRNALRKHEEQGREEVSDWANSLTEVAKIKGLELHDTGYAEFSNKVVKDVLSVLKTKFASYYLVGMEDHLSSVVEKLDFESGDVRFLVIHGKSGVGKTTLSNILFQRFGAQFQGCSFIEDIRESSKVHGSRCLENQLVSDICDDDSDSNNISERFGKKKVLIVLDDVDSKEQIENLVGNSSWFGPGSRIIVTTTNRNVLAKLDKGMLKQPKEVLTYEVREMKFDRALRLFCRHAFRRDLPPDQFTELSREVITYTGRLPLTVEIIGSFLHRENKGIWRQTIKKLKEIGPHAVPPKLKMSYEALTSESQQIFLDIACFFVNQEKTNATYMWKSCYWNNEIEELSMMSLVKVLGNKLWMHDQVREFGRNMVLKENLEDPGERSRLWEHKEALQVLTRREGKPKVEALRLGYDYSLQQHTFTDREFASLEKLRFLELYMANVDGDWEHLLDLRWLSWHYCPRDLRVTNLCSLNLVVLDLSRSSVGNQWDGWDQLREITTLKVLDLTGCEQLTKAPDLSEYKSLERLILEDCKNLVEIGSSVGSLKNLKYLNVKGCDSLVNLPEELDSLKVLEEIHIMKGNGGSFKLPHSLGNLESLRILEVVNVNLVQRPQSIAKLRRLKRLSLVQCTGITHLPDGLENLESLIELDISRTCIVQLPDSIRKLKKLKVIKMEGSSVKELPSAIGYVEKLEELYAKESRELRGNIPGTIGRLAHLRVLDLSYTGIKGLPQSINKLSQLQTLNLESCNELQELTELPEHLTTLHLRYELLQRVRNLSNLKSLVDLEIFDAFNDPPSELQIDIIHWIGNLLNLKNLELGIPDLSAPPLGFSPQLKVLKLSCESLESCSALPSSLSRLFLAHVVVQRRLPHFAKLRNLTFLNLYNCSVHPNGNLEIEQLGSLVHFSASNCHFDIRSGLRLPTGLRKLCLAECEFNNTDLVLSGLKNLKQLELWDCEKLKEVQALHELESLQELSVSDCNSLESLDLSNLRNLESLVLENCDMLKNVKGYHSLNSLKKKSICCKNLYLRKPAIHQHRIASRIGRALGHL